MGLVNLGGNGMVGILKKQGLSWLRPVDALELLTLGSLESVSLASLTDTPVLSEDSTIGASVIALAKPLRTIRSSLEPEIAAAFHLDLLHRHSPDQVASGVAMSLLTGGGDSDGISGPLALRLGQQLSSVSGIVGGIKAYLRALQLDHGNPDALSIDITINGNKLNQAIPGWLNGYMNGRLGAAIIAAVVNQLASNRLDICRDLLLLQHISLQLGQICRLQPSDAGKIRSTIIPQTNLLTQAYYALMKLAISPTSKTPPSTLEASRRQLAVLSLGDLASISTTTENTATTLELFIKASGGQHALALVSSALDVTNSSAWSDLLMPLATIIAQLAWPCSRCLLLVEFLVWGGQHCTAQEYIRLLQPWCEWNSCSRKFLLAVSFLNQGEARKASKLFLSAAEGVATEEFLGIRVAGVDLDNSPDEAKIQYFLRVIRLLEQSGHIDLALNIAQAGVTHAPPGDPGLAALYSVSFKYHLELGHHTEAFTALLACPDHYRRRNCLRQLIVTLYDRKCLSTLVNYQYGSLENEVVTILENRARSADILVNNYYNLLYSFHVKKHNFKKAASVMYECALRLNVEGMGEAGLKQQAKCYLTCLNCLGHIPKDHAWILKPVAKSLSFNGLNEDGIQYPGEKSPSPKRNSEGVSVPSRSKKVQVELLELNDIEREYQLVHARLKLFKMHPESSQSPGGPMSPADTISMLTHGKLFTDAVRLSKLYKLPITPILEGLTTVCCEADSSKDKLSQWTWLSENGMQRDSGENSGWWSLLRQILEEEEIGKQSHLHQAIAKTILKRSASLPAWLVCSYKKKNCGELLQLLVNFGLLENSVQIACDYLDAVLGRGTEEFGLPNAIHVSAPQVWVPYTALDHLKLELADLKQDPLYDKVSYFYFSFL